MPALRTWGSSADTLFVPHAPDNARARTFAQAMRTPLAMLLLAVATAALVALGGTGSEPAHAAGGSEPQTKAQLQEEIRRLERGLERHERRVEHAADRLDDAEQRYFRALEVYSDHVAALYVAGDSTRIAAIARVRDLQSAVEVATALSALADYDRDMLAEYHQALEAARARQQDLDDLGNDALAMEDELRNARHRLENWREPSKVLDLSSIETEEAEAAAPRAEHFFMTSPFPIMPRPDPVPTTPVTPPASEEPTSDDDPGDSPTSGYIEAGIASWYGPGFHGNTTANGETYDMYAMTAAHKTLPFGTIVRVTTDWGSSVTVRINDRGPFVGGRIIDLSYAAAQALGIDGVAPVEVQVVG